MTIRLLVTGNAEADVFALGELLNEHPSVVLGVRRYSAVGGLVDSSMLDARRLLSPLDVETRVHGELLYSRLRERVANEDPTVVGDIDPEHGPRLRDIATMIGDYRAVIAIAHPVSQELAAWRRAVIDTMETPEWVTRRLLVVDADAFAAGDPAWYRALLLFLELPSTDRLEAEWARLAAVDRPALTDPATFSDGDEPLREWLELRFKSELRRQDEDPRTIERREDSPLDAEQLATRSAEREQLRTQWRDSAAPARGDLLSRRYRELVGETVRRGRIIRRRELTTDLRLPDPAVRVNLVGASTVRAPIGRNDALALLARHLSQLFTVRVIADGPLGRESGDAELVIDDLEADRDCDATVVVVSEGRVPDPPSGARTIAWLDGFEPLSDATLDAALGDAAGAVAPSAELCRRAREHGIPAILLPPGIEPDLLGPSTPNEGRGLLVSAVAEVAAHAHCDELSEAMVRVRERRPEVDVTMLGGVPADGATGFLLHPTMPRAMEVLRDSAVFVNLGGEPFGHLGVVAMACGAVPVLADAAATADYAIPGRTAIVPAPIEVEALADRVLELLEDVERRAALSTAGRGIARSVMRPWRDVARVLALYLLEL